MESLVGSNLHVNERIPELSLDLISMLQVGFPEAVSKVEITRQFISLGCAPQVHMYDREGNEKGLSRGSS